MRHNQFKRFLRQQIVQECSVNEMQCAYVDVSVSTRMFYLYDLTTYRYMGSMSVFVNNTTISIDANATEVVNIANATDKLSVSYKELDKVVAFIRKFVKGSIQLKLGKGDENV